jgi:FlaA1/EpsC-like NDP-sugar epimerase
MADSYDIRKAGNLKLTLKSLGISLIASAAVYLVIYFASEPNSLPRFGVAIFLVLAVLITFFWRLIYVRLFTTASRQKRALIIGAVELDQPSPKSSQSKIHRPSRWLV